jgi:hypothetical protein
MAERLVSTRARLSEGKRSYSASAYYKPVGIDKIFTF